MSQQRPQPQAYLAKRQETSTTRSNRGSQLPPLTHLPTGISNNPTMAMPPITYAPQYGAHYQQPYPYPGQMLAHRLQQLYAYETHQPPVTPTHLRQQWTDQSPYFHPPPVLLTAASMNTRLPSAPSRSIPQAASVATGTMKQSGYPRAGYSDRSFDFQTPTAVSVPAHNINKEPSRLQRSAIVSRQQMRSTQPAPPVPYPSSKPPREPGTRRMLSPQRQAIRPMLSQTSFVPAPTTAPAALRTAPAETQAQAAFGLLNRYKKELFSRGITEDELPRIRQLLLAPEQAVLENTVLRHQWKLARDVLVKMGVMPEIILNAYGTVNAFRVQAAKDRTNATDKIPLPMVRQPLQPNCQLPRTPHTPVNEVQAAHTSRQKAVDVGQQAPEPDDEDSAPRTAQPALNHSSDDIYPSRLPPLPESCECDEHRDWHTNAQTDIVRPSKSPDATLQQSQQQQETEEHMPFELGMNSSYLDEYEKYFDAGASEENELEKDVAKESAEVDHIVNFISAARREAANNEDLLSLWTTLDDVEAVCATIILTHPVHADASLSIVQPFRSMEISTSGRKRKYSALKDTNTGSIRQEKRVRHT